MSITRIYSCNICKNPEKEDGKKSLRGFEPKRDGGIISKGTRLVEDHICLECLQGFYRMAIEGGDAP